MADNRPHVHDTVLRHALHSTNLFRSIVLTDQVWQDIESDLEIMSLASGGVLVRAGDVSDSLYIVLSGRLRVVRDTEREGETRLVELGHGQTVGEMGLITGEKRTASVYAIRDTLLARLAKPGFERLLQKYPQVIMEHFAGSVIRRLWNQVTGEARPTNTMRTLAIIPTHDGVPLPHVATQLTMALAAQGSTLHLNSARCDELLHEQGIAQALDSDAPHMKLALWLSEQEAAYRYVVYEADPTASTWTERCLRQADHILLVGAGTGTKPAPIEQALLDRTKIARTSKSLVLVHEPSTKHPTGTHAWLSRWDVGMHYHVRRGNPVDFARLARLLTGQGTGVVLSGGGAKAMAHVGVVRALIEAGLAIDMIGGVSAGATIGALYAAGFDHATVLDKCRNAANRVDYTLPFYSLTSGRKWTKTLATLFTDMQIEDLWLNFHCISANLTRAALVVHETGSLFHAMRASTSVPGVLPPVFRAGELLVDGGLITNLPVDLMRARPGIGSLIAIDVSPSKSIPVATPFAYHISGWKALWRKLNPLLPKDQIPSIMEILMQCMTISNVQAASTASAQIDYYLDPPTQAYQLQDWHKMDVIAKEGYEFGQAKIEEWRMTNAMPTPAVPDEGMRAPIAVPAEMGRL